MASATLLAATLLAHEFDPASSPSPDAARARLEQVAAVLCAELGGASSSPLARQLMQAVEQRLRQCEHAEADALQATRAALGAQALQQVRAHIEGHLGDELRLVDLAAVANLSVSHFATLFRASTGESVHQYVMRRRVERARQLLRRGGKSVCEVALEAGFSHQSHLARWMRRLLGVAPTALQREGADLVANDMPTAPQRLSA